MSKKLEGKVAIVTGASKGIGAAIALELAHQGAAVAVNYSSSKEGADKVVAEIKKIGGKAVAIHADLSQNGNIENLFAETLKKFGKLHILINNAGMYEYAALDKITSEHFHKLFDLNVLGLLLTTQEAVKHMEEGGSIINISSVVSTAGLPNTSVYSATKASVDAITRTLSKELAPRKIRVNSINPGLVETEGTHTAGMMDKEAIQKRTALIPLGRIGKPEDIAPAAAFLASDDASWITGETFYISGGFR